jgi:hypothetical protein
VTLYRGRHHELDRDADASTAPCGAEITVTTLSALGTSSGEITSSRVTIALTGNALSAVIVRRSTSP